MWRENEEQALAVFSNERFVGTCVLSKAKPKSFRCPWTDGDEKGSAYPVNVIQRVVLSYSQSGRTILRDILSNSALRHGEDSIENHKRIYMEKPVATHQEAKIGSNFSHLPVARE